MPITELLGSAGLFWQIVLRFVHCPFLLLYRDGMISFLLLVASMRCGSGIE